MRTEEEILSMLESCKHEVDMKIEALKYAREEGWSDTTKAGISSQFLKAKAKIDLLTWILS